MDTIEVRTVQTRREKNIFVTFPWHIYREDLFWVPPLLPERKKVIDPPEYWDTGVGVLLFDEMVRRAVAKGYTWADLSLTGEYNKDTWPLAHRMGAKSTSATAFTKNR
jgi:hypothetical protein